MSTELISSIKQMQLTPKSLIAGHTNWNEYSDEITIARNDSLIAINTF